jgi:hypothetical protein
MEDTYYITETTTWKVYAESEEQARKIWNEYWCDGVEPSQLVMKLADNSVEADWQWTREEGDN